MARVEHAGTVIAMTIESLNVTWSGQGTAKIGIGNTVRIGVVGQKGEVLREAMLDGHQQSLVVSHRAVIHRIDAGVGRAQRRILKRENATGLGVPCDGARPSGRQAVLTGVTVPRNVDRRVDFTVVAPQVGGLVAQVADGRDPRAELPLIGGIPVCHVGRFGVDGKIYVDAGGRKKRLSIGRKWIPAWIFLPRIGEPAYWIDRVDGSANRSIGGFPFVEPGLIDLVEQGAAYPERIPSVAVRIPHNAGARREVGIVSVPVRGGNSGVARERQSGRRIR